MKADEGAEQVDLSFKERATAMLHAAFQMPHFFLVLTFRSLRFAV